MVWRSFFEKSEAALALESALSLTLVKHHGGLPSTANTNVETRVINLDVSQPAAKVALSYAYELMNFNNIARYQEVINRAKNNQITAVDYVNSITAIEAEAALFRCEVFHSFNLPRDNYPANPKYLELYDKCHGRSHQEKIRIFQRFILDEGIVRRQFTVKGYYLDQYRYYTGKQNWPQKYDNIEKLDTIIISLQT